jgi:hypothetical protein
MLNPYTGNVDTNALIIRQISTNILASGGVVGIGLPQRTPRSPWTNYLAPGFYSVSNINLRSAYVINVTDSGSQLYDATNILHSGFNTYVTINTSAADVIAIMATNSAASASRATNGPDGQALDGASLSGLAASVANNTITTRLGNSNNYSGTFTGNLTGNAATATSATTAGSATTATSATSATNATNAANLVAANFSVVQSGTNLLFQYNGTTIAVLDSTGNFTAKNNVTAYGSI